MFHLGESQELYVVKEVGFGIYLGEEENATEKVLLPKKEVPEGIKAGDILEVFLYKDSQDRLIATTRTPKVRLGETAVLRVADTGKSVHFWTGDWKRICFFHIKSRQSVCSRGKSVWQHFILIRAADSVPR